MTGGAANINGDYISDVAGWETLHEFDDISDNKQFDARIYKQKMDNIQL